MTISRAEIQLRAGHATQSLSEVERMAVAATIMLSIQHPDSWACLRHFERLVRDQANGMLAKSVMDQEWADKLLPTRPFGFPRASGATALPDDQPETPVTNGAVNAVWQRIRAVEQRLSNSLCGDIIGLICLGITLAGLFMFAPLIIR